METISVKQEVDELKKLFSYSKKIGFFFGAGSSCSFGLPNVKQLTESVEDELEGNLKESFRIAKNSLSELLSKAITVEDILNYTRQIRDITGGKKDKIYEGIDGETATILDERICKSIFEIIHSKEEAADISQLRKFLAWLDIANRKYSKEIFTTNYDLLLEKAMELNNNPYFDGFVGAYEPFFWPESIENNVTSTDMTFNWIRLWKLHGSLNWEFINSDSSDYSKIIRVGKNIKHENELVVYPSREKYSLSRKQPFLAYFDRLKKFMSHGEVLLVISGYSFSDQHINEIIYTGLRQNPRVYSIVFCYSDEQVESMKQEANSYLNLCVMGPKKMIVNGKIYCWDFKNDNGKADDSSYYWDKTKNEFLLGDFKNMVDFLVNNSGKTNKVEEILNGK